MAAGCIFSGRVEIAVTDTPVSLGDTQPLNWLIVQGAWGNKECVAVGDAVVSRDGSITDGPRLDPGQFAPQAGVCDRVDVFINGLKGDAVNYWAGYVAAAPF